jgi:hypothetical protein
MNLFGAADVGKKGAIVIIDEESNIVFKSSIPLIGNEYDKIGIFNIFCEYNIELKHFILEDVHSIFGSSAKSNFQFGRGKGLLEMTLVSAEIPHTLVQPKKWQTIWEGVPKQYKPTTKTNKKGEPIKKIDTKATSLITAQRLFPTVDLRENSRCKVPHDGIVDALLMAEYCRRTYGK